MHLFDVKRFCSIFVASLGFYSSRIKLNNGNLMTWIQVLSLVITIIIALYTPIALASLCMQHLKKKSKRTARDWTLNKNNKTKRERMREDERQREKRTKISTSHVSNIKDCRTLLSCIQASSFSTKQRKREILWRQKCYSILIKRKISCHPVNWMSQNRFVKFAQLHQLLHFHFFIPFPHT